VNGGAHGRRGDVIAVLVGLAGTVRDVQQLGIVAGLDDGAVFRHQIALAATQPDGHRLVGPDADRQRVGQVERDVGALQVGDSQDARRQLLRVEGKEVLIVDAGGAHHIGRERGGRTLDADHVDHEERRTQ